MILGERLPCHLILSVLERSAILLVRFLSLVGVSLGSSSLTVPSRDGTAASIIYQLIPFLKL